MLFFQADGMKAYADIKHIEIKRISRVSSATGLSGILKEKSCIQNRANDTKTWAIHLPLKNKNEWPLL